MAEQTYIKILDPANYGKIPLQTAICEIFALRKFELLRMVGTTAILIVSRSPDRFSPPFLINDVIGRGEGSGQQPIPFLFCVSRNRMW